MHSVVSCLKQKSVYPLETVVVIINIAVHFVHLLWCLRVKEALVFQTMIVIVILIVVVISIACNCLGVNGAVVFTTMLVIVILIAVVIVVIAIAWE